MEQRSITDTLSDNDKLIKSGGGPCFSNTFNPNFKTPNALSAAYWCLWSKNNTSLPTDIKELNKTLPVEYPNRDKIWKESGGIRFIWIGHASCLVQIDNFMFLTDPVFSDRCGLTPQLGQKRYRPPALTIDDLPDQLDAVLISHNHFDHLDSPSVRLLNRRYGNSLTWFCGLGGRQWFINESIDNIIELDWWEEWQHPV